MTREELERIMNMHLDIGAFLMLAVLYPEEFQRRIDETKAALEQAIRDAQ